MPRTKVLKTASQLRKNEEASKLRALLEQVRRKKSEALAVIEKEKKSMLEAYDVLDTEDRLSVPARYLNMTIREIINSQSMETTSSGSCILSKGELLNITKSIKRERKTVRRSTSFPDDEGGRKSRIKARVPQSTRSSRSLSRSNTQKTSNLITPTSKNILPNSYGVVTPKCKPNTPQVLLRRPKNGEVALSMQGSPLYTASVVTESVANINIPLLDGRMLSLQPQRGLRISQIPQFDPETLRQLNTLRENLTKVCEFSDIK